MYQKKTIRTMFTSNKGEISVEIPILIVSTVLLFVFAINVFGVVINLNKLNSAADELMYLAEARGVINEDIDSKIAELQQTTGMNFSAVWDTTYFDESEKTIQYNTEIHLLLEAPSSIGVGDLQLPITLKSNTTGNSKKYYKELEDDVDFEE